MIPANIVRQTLSQAEAAAIDSALRHAISRAETETMHNALLAGGDATLVLNHAINQLDDALIKTAMSHNADPMVLTPYAVTTGKQEWLDMAITAGAITTWHELNADQQEKLCQAFGKNLSSANPNPALALQAGIDADVMLYRCIASKNLTGVSLALEAGAAPNNSATIRMMNNSGLHISHMAYDHYNENILERLIKAGMSLEQRDSYGSTPLYRALSDRHYTRAEFLVKHGADPLAASGNGVMPLQLVEINTGITDQQKNKLNSMMLKNLADKKQVIAPDFNDVSMQQPVKLIPQIKINPKRTP